MTEDQPPAAGRRLGPTIVRRAMAVLASPSKFAVVGVLGIVVNQVALVVLTETFGIGRVGPGR